MLFRSEVKLLVFSAGQDDIGNDVLEEVSNRTIMANEKSLQRSEFYQAAATQFRPEIVFEIRSIEYQRETRLRHEGINYNIIRTYSRNQEITELVCERVVYS